MNGNVRNPGASVSFPNSTVYSGAAPAAYTDLDLSLYIGTRKCLVYLTVESSEINQSNYWFRENGSADDTDNAAVNVVYIKSTKEAGVVCITSDTGIIEWKHGNPAGTTILKLEAFIYE